MKKRWVNDNNIARMVMVGYRPEIPLNIKDVGNNTFAMCMEIADADYKQRQENKQVKNDLIGGRGDIDVENYEKDIRTEALLLISHKITSWVFFRLMVKKCFGKHLFKYIEEIVNEPGRGPFFKSSSDE